MNTSIRKGQSIFYGDKTFSHGLSRSGYFNKRESEELALYGLTFEGLCNGHLSPENDEEAQFIAAMNNENAADCYPANLWKKYLAALAKSKSHHGFAMSNGRTKSDAQGNDLSFA